MGQVVSVKVTPNFEQACSVFRNEANISESNDRAFTGGDDLVIIYDETAHEIRCEGHLSDSVISALIEVKEQFGGKLFYEGEEFDDNDDIEGGESSVREIAWIVLSVIFFPITLIYLFLRILVWLPLKTWKTTE